MNSVNKRALDFSDHLHDGGLELDIFKKNQAFEYTGVEDLENERKDRHEIFFNFVSSFAKILEGEYYKKYELYMTCD